MYTASEKIAELRNASDVSLTVSLYSGANAAQVSTPYADQPMSHSQANAACQLGTVHVRFELSQSPVMYGSTMKTPSGIIISAPVA
jgi:hypothetical protein